MEARAEEAQELHSRNLQLHRMNAALKADLASLQAELRRKERQLQVYEEGLGQSLDGSTFQPGLLPITTLAGTTNVTPSSSSTEAHVDIPGKVRTIMNEAYLVKTALKSQSDWKRSQLSVATLKALDDWIFATHTLKKAISSDEFETGKRLPFDASI